MKNQFNKISKRWLIIAAALLSMVGPFSIDTYLPSFPSIEAEFQVSRALISQSLGAYLAGFAVMTLIWGPLTDRFGRKPIIFASASLYLVASLGCALTDNFQTFMLSRILQGMAASGGYVAGRAMIRDSFNEQDARKAMSQVMMLFAIAPAISPIIGGALHNLFGWRSVFYFLAFYGAVVLMIALLRIKESLPVEQQQSLHPLHVTKVYSRALLHARFMTLVLTTTLSFAGFFIYVVGAPTIIFDVLQWQAEDFIYLFAPVTAGIVIGAFVTNKLTHYLSSEQTINVGFFLTALAVVLNLLQVSFLPTSALISIAPLVLYAFSLAMIMPNITILALDCFPKNRGSAAAMQGFTQMLSNALLASVIAPLLGSEAVNFVWVQAVVFLMAFFLWLSISKRNV
ncbi:MAG: multidrug effflux MFS transporter [Cocleimonas sp.]|nr:multidrug effflux MFS transporter [Cocleimonas sp.]